MSSCHDSLQDGYSEMLFKTLLIVLFPVPLAPYIILIFFSLSIMTLSEKVAMSCISIVSIIILLFDVYILIIGSAAITISSSGNSYLLTL